MPGIVKLEIVRGHMKGREFVFDEHDTFLFGRHPDCHAHLPDDSFVSRHHFIIEANPPDIRLRDLGSLNGTYVNKTKYGSRDKDETPEDAADREFPEVDLKDRDKIYVGETVFEVRVELPADEDEHAGRAVVCEECGRDASDEVGGTRHGTYVCAKCRARVKDDPMRLLRSMAEEVSPGKGRKSVPDISGYEIGKKLGQGGMGVVYLARSIADNNVVALKMMLPKVAVDERSRDVFLRETAILQDLRHPNIVSLLGNGVRGTTFYVVMEYCNGGDLLGLMKQQGGALNLDTAEILMLQILDGLTCAHDKNFVHRDLKPQNILLHNERGSYTAKIADFGLAKNFERAGLSGMTATGSYSGTLLFMPREQLVRFKYVQPVSDVWSIAATFYFMLTGWPPRDLKPDRDPMQAVLQEKAKPIRDREPTIPEPLAKVFDRALQTNPDKRYPSAREFRDALQEALDEVG